VRGEKERVGEGLQEQETRQHCLAGNRGWEEICEGFSSKHSSANDFICGMCGNIFFCLFPLEFVLFEVMKIMRL